MSVSEAYDGKQIVGIDLHRRRSVLVRMTQAGEKLETIRISNDPEYLRQVMAWVAVSALVGPTLTEVSGPTRDTPGVV